MVAGFNRSFSLPGSPRLIKTRPAPSKPYHIRSISLPCRSHPLISSLEDDIRSVKAWIHSTQPEPASASSAWLCDGLARLELLHVSLNDLLDLPQSRYSLRSGSGSEWTDRVLNDFLRLADAHGSLRSETVSLNDHQSEAQIAVRRKDGAKLESCIRSMKKIERQLVKLVASLREHYSKSSSPVRFTNGTEDAELAGIIREAISVTVSASAALFVGIASVSNAAVACLSAKSSCWTPTSRRREDQEKEEACRRNSMEKLRGLEECVGAVEKKSERVFRCLLNTRVALLGLMTPSLL